MNKLSEIRTLVTEYNAKKNEMSKDQLKALKTNIKTMKKSLHNDWQSWKKFTKDVIRLKPV